MSNYRFQSLQFLPRQRLRRDFETQEKSIREELRHYAFSINGGHRNFYKNFNMVELTDAIKRVKSGKIPGPDNFHPEFLKHWQKSTLCTIRALQLQLEHWYPSDLEKGCHCSYKDLPGILTSDGLTNAALFAGDLTVWCCAFKEEQSDLNAALNKSLERLEVWCLENNMIMNVEKTTSQYFTLNRQPFNTNLAFRGPLLQHNDVSTYLGCILDSKLK
ncbi:putative RNA-directed DNA polymerase from transposon X-element [Trichonephila clavipes]|nr:putative RNA-directed DNA polymerase from transposon X-element [Trichonephila clavipes]